MGRNRASSVEVVKKELINSIISFINKRLFNDTLPDIEKLDVLQRLIGTFVGNMVRMNQELTYQIIENILDQIPNIRGEKK